MRLSITLDPDLHQMAAARARARNTSISREINDLIRQATTSSHSAIAPSVTHEGRRRFPVSQGGLPFTLEDVRRAEDEEDLRHLPPLLPAAKSA